MSETVINVRSFLRKVKPERNKEITKKVKRNKLYWISQFSGWGLYVFVNVLVISSIDIISLNRLALWILLGILGIIYSHVYRIYIKKHNWANLPLKKIVPRVLFASLIGGILIYFPEYFATTLLKVDKQFPNTIALFFAGIMNIASVILVWSLIYFAVHFFENSQKAEIETLIFEAAVKDFELKTLKAQLNPHFMFNAMNSIRALIEEDPQNAKDAITKLSNLMRYTLKIERTETVTLAEELKTIQDYLDLEKIRFEERLNYKIKSTPESERIEIPPMMVQTLVENGIKHGISKITSGGEVFIDTKTENAKLIIEIRNTGNVSEDAIKYSHGFGISNTKHRLALLYGENASFTLVNENQKTVLAKLIIPLGGLQK